MADMTWTDSIGSRTRMMSMGMRDRFAYRFSTDGGGGWGIPGGAVSIGQTATRLQREYGQNEPRGGLWMDTRYRAPSTAYSSYIGPTITIRDRLAQQAAESLLREQSRRRGYAASIFAGANAAPTLGSGTSLLGGGTGG